MVLMWPVACCVCIQYVKAIAHFVGGISPRKQERHLRVSMQRAVRSSLYAIFVVMQFDSGGVCQRERNEVVSCGQFLATFQTEE